MLDIPQNSFRSAAGGEPSAAVAPRRQTALRDALIVLVVAAATIAGAFLFQRAGYAPCELCLKERQPYYLGMVVALVTAGCAYGARRLPTRIGFAVLALIFAFSALFGAYHAGVEWGFWPGPSDCTGTLTKAGSNADFLRQLSTVKVVRCDAVAIRVAGLSLAGWNAVVSLTLAVVAAIGLRRA